MLPVATEKYSNVSIAGISWGFDCSKHKVCRNRLTSVTTNDERNSGLSADDEDNTSGFNCLKAMLK